MLYKYNERNKKALAWETISKLYNALLQRISIHIPDNLSRKPYQRYCTTGIIIHFKPMQCPTRIIMYPCYAQLIWKAISKLCNAAQKRFVVSCIHLVQESISKLCNALPQNLCSRTALIYLPGKPFQRCTKPYYIDFVVLHFTGLGSHLISKLRNGVQQLFCARLIQNVCELVQWILGHDFCI